MTKREFYEMAAKDNDGLEVLFFPHSFYATALQYLDPPLACQLEQGLFGCMDRGKLNVLHQAQVFSELTEARELKYDTSDAVMENQLPVV